jgi:hypothetical protein
MLQLLTAQADMRQGIRDASNPSTQTVSGDALRTTLLYLFGAQIAHARPVSLG